MGRFKMNGKTIYSRILPDGRMQQHSGDGNWAYVENPPLGPTPPDFVPAYDPENPPLTSEQLKRMKRVVFAKHLRFKFGLTQEQFSERYNIPIGTLRDWEQHRSEPDAPAKALLKLIAADPEGAAEVLKPVARTAAE
jgi:putative transcriptional regulator